MADTVLILLVPGCELAVISAFPELFPKTEVLRHSNETLQKSERFCVSQIKSQLPVAVTYGVLRHISVRPITEISNSFFVFFNHIVFDILIIVPREQFIIRQFRIDKYHHTGNFFTGNVSSFYLPIVSFENIEGTFNNFCLFSSSGIIHQTARETLQLSKRKYYSTSLITLVGTNIALTKSSTELIFWPYYTCRITSSPFSPLSNIFQRLKRFLWNFLESGPFNIQTNKRSYTIFRKVTDIQQSVCHREYGGFLFSLYLIGIFFSDRYNSNNSTEKSNNTCSQRLEFSNSFEKWQIGICEDTSSNAKYAAKNEYPNLGDYMWRDSHVHNSASLCNTNQPLIAVA